uniref:Uncharacterized protein n=1 Tax=Oryza meridionalis TaxID=40149 RepID=A0A0E0EN59_9ORYZ
MWFVFVDVARTAAHGVCGGRNRASPPPMGLTGELPLQATLTNPALAEISCGAGSQAERALAVLLEQYMRQRVSQSARKRMIAMGRPKDIHELKVMGFCSGKEEDHIPTRMMFTPVPVSVAIPPIADAYTTPSTTALENRRTSCPPPSSMSPPPPRGNLCRIPVATGIIMTVHAVLWIHMLTSAVVPVTPRSSSDGRTGSPQKRDSTLRARRRWMRWWSTARARMKLPRTREMTSPMYALATSEEEEMPKAGKRNSGAMDATASGTAPVTHQRNTHASTPSMFRASPCPSPRSTAAHTAAHAAGPAAIAGYLCASRARTHAAAAAAGRRRSPFAIIPPLAAGSSSGASTSSDELSP